MEYLKYLFYFLVGLFALVGFAMTFFVILPVLVKPKIEEENG